LLIAAQRASRDTIGDSLRNRPRALDEIRLVEKSELMLGARRAGFQSLEEVRT
jgi:hypothetical protein